jgi:hypothetical protein
MKQFLDTSLDYLIDVVISTSSQLLILFGPLLLLAFLMSLISRANQVLSCKLFGNRIYLYVFGWLGTSIHELGHAFFALIFGHHITEIKLFSPKSDDGSLGHVTHTYNRKNIYQNIGNFFIGIGPILFGSVVLFLLIFFLYDYSLLKNSDNLSFTPGEWVTFSSLKQIAVDSWNHLLTFVNRIFAGNNIVWWKTALLVYVLYSVGSSITLSLADIKGTARGFVFTIGVLFIFNLLTLWIGNFSIEFFIRISRFFSGLYFLILFTMAINMVFIAILFLINLIKPS